MNEIREAHEPKSITVQSHGVSSGVIKRVENVFQDGEITIFREHENFLMLAEERGFMNKLEDIYAYHVSPSCNRDNILKEGFHNNGAIFSQKQELFFKNFLSRLPQLQLPGYDVDSMIFGIKKNGRRGVYISFNDGFSYAYAIPESVRFYFTCLSENFDLLTDDEKRSVKIDFGIFNNRFLQGTDIWKIQILFNPELFGLCFPYLKEFYNAFEESFIKYDKLIPWSNIEYPGIISPSGAEVIDTEYKSSTEIWGKRCSRLIETL